MFCRTRLPVGVVCAIFGVCLLTAGAAGQLPTLPPADTAGAAPPAQLPAGQVPAKQTPIRNSLNWDDLTCQILPQIVSANIDMGTVLLTCRSANFVMDVIVTPQGMAAMRATLSCSWEDANDDGELSDGEITIEADAVSSPNMRPLLRDVIDRIKTQLKRNGLGMAAQCTIKTRKGDDGFHMTIQTGKDGAAGGLELNVLVTADFRVARVDTALDDGTTVSATYHYVRAGQQWVPDECVEQVRGRGGEFMVRQRLGYEAQANVPMLTRISAIKTVSSIAGSYSIREEYTARNWRVVKRDKPLDALALLAKGAGLDKAGGETAAAVPEVKVEKTEQAKALAQKTLKQLTEGYALVWGREIGSFEAVYSVQLDGKAVGTVKASSLLKTRQLDLTVEGAAGDAAKANIERMSRLMLGGVISFPLALSDPRKPLYAASVQDQVYIDATEAAPTEAAKSILITVPADMHELRNLIVYPDGKSMEMTIGLQPLDGKYHLSSLVMSVGIRGQTVGQETYQYRNSRKFGPSFPETVTVKEVGGEEPGTFVFSLQNATFGSAGSLKELEDDAAKFDEDFDQLIQEALRKQREKLQQPQPAD